MSKKTGVSSMSGTVTYADTCFCEEEEKQGPTIYHFELPTRPSILVRTNFLFFVKLTPAGTSTMNIIKKALLSFQRALGL